ncbi:hydroxyethylthiazole kinase [Streptococcus equinus]|uniref:Hydroxyethylthiazole kinase n=1 Tax=Streptococcus equinus TaxID=1335 RepID=A0A1G9I664_STREI|nr:hydroxyethylthiazole kinase [Streptococcus equinus]SDL20709.1 hydroxyethylthiazole kinase [Streptococcus equinus]
MSYLDELRKQNPLTICITNDVVKNFTANGLLALGASPAMSEYQKDLEDFLPSASGLLINIGTLSDKTWQLYKDALDIAEKNGVPTVLDPVAAGVGPYRKRVANDLIENHKLSLIRGNAGEIAALIGEDVASKGVDSADVANIGQLALKAHKQLKLPIVITGKTDAIAVNGHVKLLHNGSSLMPLVTGTGCLLGAVLAAFIGVASDDLLSCLEEAMSVYNIAGEIAERNSGIGLPGSFQVAFIDALHQISNDDIEKMKKVEDYCE